MKRIIACVLIVCILTMMMGTIQVSAAPVAVPVAIGIEEVVKLILGMAAYFGIRNAFQASRNETYDRMTQTIRDELALTNPDVQALAPYTDALDADADNGTIIRNYMQNHSTLWTKTTKLSVGFFHAVFDGVSATGRFLKAVLSMLNHMMSAANLNKYTIPGQTEIPVDHQGWLNLPYSPCLTSAYPYQVITSIDSSYYILGVATVPWLHDYYYLANTIGSYYEYTLVNNEWVYQGLKNQRLWWSQIKQSNRTIDTFAKTTTDHMDGYVPASSMYTIPISVTSQSTAVWTGNSIAVPNENTASDVIAGTLAPTAIMDAITADNSIAMENTAAGTLAGTVEEVPVTFQADQWTVPTLITQKFPFCLPWDVKRMFEAFLAPAMPPKWTVDMTAAVPGVKFDIDLAPFEPLAKIIRFFVYAAFLLALAMNTRKVVPSL